MAPKVLVVLTSYGAIENADNKPTGWFLPEFAHPYEVLAGKGVEIVTASPKGGAAPLDPNSVAGYTDASSAAFLESQAALWERTAPIKSFLGRAGEFAALFYPGGHGPMFDLVGDDDSIALIAEFVAAGKPVAALCHGPVVFTDVILPGGHHMLTGREVTGLSNAEEQTIGMDKHVPFLLEDRLKAAGALYVKAPEPFEPFVAVDDHGRLITGQNPASSKAVGEALARAIGL
ncbi:DJ-1/PfpI family protein [Hypoxylon cercidicola]|nr:DJ-1/PfpI family protein [Hypoxylon cercidicola]